VIITDNYLAAEKIIVEHLRANVPDINDVLSVTDLVGIDEISQPAPAIYVAFNGDSPVEDAKWGMAQSFLQRWMIWLVVRNLRGPGHERHDAGKLSAQIIDALGPNRPPEFKQTIRRTGIGSPIRKESGYTYYPFQYELLVVTM
jgi:hypothetical protein